MIKTHLTSQKTFLTHAILITYL